MKKFRRFLGRISAKAYLKWIILVVNPQLAKHCLRIYYPLPPAAGGFALGLPFDPFAFSS